MGITEYYDSSLPTFQVLMAVVLVLNICVSFTNWVLGNALLHQLHAKSFRASGSKSVGIRANIFILASAMLLHWSLWNIRALVTSGGFQMYANLFLVDCSIICTLQFFICVTLPRTVAVKTQSRAGSASKHGAASGRRLSLSFDHSRVLRKGETSISIHYSIAQLSSLLITIIAFVKPILSAINVPSSSIKSLLWAASYLLIAIINGVVMHGASRRSMPLTRRARLLVAIGTLVIPIFYVCYFSYCFLRRNASVYEDNGNIQMRLLIQLPQMFTLFMSFIVASISHQRITKRLQLAARKRLETLSSKRWTTVKKTVNFTTADASTPPESVNRDGASRAPSRLTISRVEPASSATDNDVNEVARQSAVDQQLIILTLLLFVLVLSLFVMTVIFLLPASLAQEEALARLLYCSIITAFSTWAMLRVADASRSFEIPATVQFVERHIYRSLKGSTRSADGEVEAYVLLPPRVMDLWRLGPKVASNLYYFGFFDLFMALFLPRMAHSTILLADMADRGVLFLILVTVVGAVHALGLYSRIRSLSKRWMSILVASTVMFYDLVRVSVLTAHFDAMRCSGIVRDGITGEQISALTHPGAVNAKFSNFYFPDVACDGSFIHNMLNTALMVSLLMFYGFALMYEVFIKQRLSGEYYSAIPLYNGHMFAMSVGIAVIKSFTDFGSNFYGNQYPVMLRLASPILTGLLCLLLGLNMVNKYQPYLGPGSYHANNLEAATHGISIASNIILCLMRLVGGSSNASMSEWAVISLISLFVSGFVAYLLVRRRAASFDLYSKAKLLIESPLESILKDTQFQTGSYFASVAILSRRDLRQSYADMFQDNVDVHESLSLHDMSATHGLRNQLIEFMLLASQSYDGRRYIMKNYRADLLLSLRCAADASDAVCENYAMIIKNLSSHSKFYTRQFVEDLSVHTTVMACNRLSVQIMKHSAKNELSPLPTLLASLAALTKLLRQLTTEAKTQSTHLTIMPVTMERMIALRDTDAIDKACDNLLINVDGHNLSVTIDLLESHARHEEKLEAAILDRRRLQPTSTAALVVHEYIPRTMLSNLISMTGQCHLLTLDEETAQATDVPCAKSLLFVIPTATVRDTATAATGVNAAHAIKLFLNKVNISAELHVTVVFRSLEDGLPTSQAQITDRINGLLSDTSAPGFVYAGYCDSTSWLRHTTLDHGHFVRGFIELATNAASAAPAVAISPNMLSSMGLGVISRMRADESRVEPLPPSKPVMITKHAEASDMHSPADSDKAMKTLDFMLQRTKCNDERIVQELMASRGLDVRNSLAGGLVPLLHHCCFFPGRARLVSFLLSTAGPDINGHIKVVGNAGAGTNAMDQSDAGADTQFLTTVFMLSRVLFGPGEISVGFMDKILSPAVAKLAVTPLHIAAAVGDLPTCQILVDSGATWSTVETGATTIPRLDKSGRTIYIPSPATLAEQRGHIHLLDLFEKSYSIIPTVPLKLDHSPSLLKDSLPTDKES